MWNVKKNVWLINFFVTLNFAWEGVREAGDLCALKTDIEKEIKKSDCLKRPIDVSASMPLIFEMSLSLCLRTAMMKSTLRALFIKFNR